MGEHGRKNKGKNLEYKRDYDIEIKDFRKQTLEAAKQKFSPSGTAEQQFWTLLELSVKIHEGGNDHNRENYFDQNTDTSRIASISGLKENFQSILLGIFRAGLLAAGVFHAVDWANSASVFNRYALILEIILLILSFFFKTKRTRLKLRRYGETWIRHSTALSEYDLELMRFVYGLAPYDSGPPQIQRKLFQEKILSIQQRNQKRFEENMKKLEEYIE